MKALKHLKTILRHKYWVGKYCFKAGIPVQGIIHDLSKFSSTEFVESVKYYQGNRSPIDACKEANGYSMAWMHHKGRNPHHYEYWQDNFDNGGKPLIMPYKYAIEMLCDYMGAGRAYMKENFSYESEQEWWKNKKSKPLAMHPAIKIFLNLCFDNLDACFDKPNNKKYLKETYEYAIRTYKEEIEEEKYVKSLERKIGFIHD